MSGPRIDKWLWAARFFKTRAKAKEAIDGGKVHVNGSRTKPSKEAVIGDTIKITQGWGEKIVIVRALSEQRRGAPIAEQLYEETVASRTRRELEAEQRRATGEQIMRTGKPTKKTRRLIHQFRHKNLG